MCTYQTTHVAPEARSGHALARAIVRQLATAPAGLVGELQAL